jgi:hypothetical protein
MEGKAHTIEEISQRTIVEQHLDNPNRLHFYFYTIGKPLRDKSSDNSRYKDEVDANGITAFEVKGSSKYLSFCCPNIHRDGYQIEILGTKEILTLRGNVNIDLFQNHIDNICRKYGLYHSGSYGSNSDQIPIEELFKEDTVILEGHNRHEQLLRVMESLIKRNHKILSLSEIQKIASEWNIKHCSPHLDDIEFNK